MAINIVSADPAAGSIGVPIHKEVSAIFDAPLDPFSIGDGTFFLESSDKRILSGPYQPMRYPGSSPHDPLSSPALHAIVKGRHEYIYLDTNNSALATDFTDTAGTATYRTKIIFYPEQPLTPLHPYRLYICGTATSQFTSFGIRRRTVYDVMADPANAGNGSVYATGGYNGLTTATMEVRIVGGGVVGSASYQWRRNAESYSPVSLSHSWTRHLRDGVQVLFDLAGTFQAGDTFRWLVKPTEYLANVTMYAWTTGDSGTQVAPNDTSLLVSRVAPTLPSQFQGGLALDHTMPWNMASYIATDQSSFTFYFNQALSTSFDTNGMQIIIGPANGDPSITTDIIYTPNRVSVQNSTELTIYLDNT